MLAVIALFTFLQFRYLGKRVQYDLN
jgi:hypothetical protein